MGPSARSRDSRQRLGLLMGLLAALAFLAIGLISFWGSEPAEDGADDAARLGSSPDSVSDSKQPKAGQAEREGVGRSDPSKMASANPSIKRERGEGQTFFRISGIVADLEGRPLEGAGLRWIPTGLADLWHCSLDVALIGGDAARIPEGPLRDALLLSRSARSDAQGFYELEADQRVPGVVAASAPGYETSLRRVPGSEVTGPQGLRTIRMDFLLRFGGSISGTVIEAETGRPARGMSVAAAATASGASAIFARPGSDYQAALVDSRGRYTLQGLPPGTYRVAPKTSFSPYVSLSFEAAREVTLEAGSEIDDLDFEVVVGGRITGRVRNPRGEGVPGVYCSALPDLDGDSLTTDPSALEIFNQGRQETGAYGRFEFRGLPLNRSYIIKARSSQTPEVHSRSVLLTPESPQAEVDLQINAGSRIEGRVAFADGSAPGAGAIVLASAQHQDPTNPLRTFAGRSARTDEDGGFSLGPLSEGEYRLEAHLPGSPQKRVRSEAQIVEVDGRKDVSGIVLRLQEEEEEQRQVSGMVVDDLGLPLEGAMVQAFSEQSVFNSAVSRPDGSFRLLTTAEGPLRITAEKAHHSPAVLTAVEIGRKDVVLMLDRPGQISGQVTVSGGGRLPADGRVELFANPEEVASKLADPRFEAGTFTKVAGDGTFQIDSQAGRVELVARFSGFAPVRSGPITVRSGEETAGIKLVLRHRD